MAHEDYIRLEIQDRDDPAKWTPIDRWEEYSIHQSVWQPCDNFSLTPVPELYPKFMAGGQKVRLYCNESLRFTGCTDETAHNPGATDRKLSITGRDMMQFLVDSTAEPQSLANQTLAELAHKLADPWMPDFILSIVTDNAPSFYRLIGRKKTPIMEEYTYLDPITLKTSKRQRIAGHTKAVRGGKSSPYYRGTDQDRIRDTWIDGNTKIWEVLSEHAKRVACTMWGTVDGSLFIGRPRYDEYVHEPSLVFNQKGTGNVLNATFTKGTSERFSHWKFWAEGRKGKNDKGKSIFHKIDVIDPGPAFWRYKTDDTRVNRLYRPTTIAVRKGCQDANLLRRLARTAMEWSLIQTYKYVVDVEGHGWPVGSKDATQWAYDCCVNVKDEVNDVSGPHYVFDIELSRNKDTGRKTSLHLIPSGIWLALDHDQISDKEYEEYMRWKALW